MKWITSGDNQIYKITAQLKQKKYRDKLEKYVIEGPNLISEALQNNGKIEWIIRSADFDWEAVKNAESLNGEIPPVAGMSSDLFCKLTDTETPQGVLAVVHKKVYTEKEFFESGRSGSNVIVLDRLQDPGNIGTILRTADAAGYMGAILMKGTGDVYSPKVVRAAAGSLFRLPVLLVDSPEEALDLLKKYDKQIICTTPNCDRYFYDIDFSSNIALIIGNEGNGACEGFLNHSDYNVKIPMEGNVESLNAAVSAGILMFESVRQNFRE